MTKDLGDASSGVSFCTEGDGWNVANVSNTMKNRASSTLILPGSRPATNHSAPAPILPKNDRFGLIKMPPHQIASKVGIRPITAMPGNHQGTALMPGSVGHSQAEEPAVQAEPGRWPESSQRHVVGTLPSTSSTNRWQVTSRRNYAGNS